MGAGGGPDHPVVVAPLAVAVPRLPEGVRLVEPAAALAGSHLPGGFLAAGMCAGLKESGRPDMGVLAVAPEWRHAAASAAVFTTNAFAAAPGASSTGTRRDLAQLLAVVMNSGNANACTGEPGLVVARAMQKACAETLGVPAANVAVGPTGIIGVQLDPRKMAAGAGKAAAAVEAGWRAGLRPGHPDHRPLPQDVRAGSDSAGRRGPAWRCAPRAPG